MTSFKIPYFDKRTTYSKSFYTDNKLQKYMALFLSNPENYIDIGSLPHNSKETYFMNRFSIFLQDYVIIDYERNFDTFIYFRALNIDKKGTIDVCGGTGKISNSAKKQFKGEYSDSQEENIKIRKYLTEKYKYDFNPTLPDPRLFIGHHEVWNNPSPELLNLENWNWVVDKSYNDIQLKKPLPNDLDGDLIPLSIRNKTLQKWENDKRRKREIELFKVEQLYKLKLKDELDEEKEYIIRSKNNTPKATSISIEEDW